MRKPALLAAVAAAVVTGPAFAETLRSATTFNTGAQKPAAEQPADGVAVIYPASPMPAATSTAARRRSPRASTLATRGPGASTRSRPT